MYIFITEKELFHTVIELNSIFNVKCSPYHIRFTNNFIINICKSNIWSMNVIMVASNLLNELSNHTKLISSYVSYKC